MRCRALATVIVLAGCGGHTFTNLGNGTAVPTETVEAYAEDHGISVEQARQAMRAEDEAKKAKSAEQ